MEFNDYGNAVRAPSVRVACQAEGLIFTIWLTRNFTGPEVRQAAIQSGCDGIALEGEIPAEIAPGVPNPQAVNWQEVIQQTADLPIHKAVVTNMAPFTHYDGSPYPELSAPLVENDWACLTECYDLDGDPKLWIERRDFFAKHLGWTSTQPVIGLYGGRTWADFPTYDDYANGSVWAAEYVL